MPNPPSTEVDGSLRCERCREPIDPRASYCDNCGERTRRARTMVRRVLSVELILVALATFLVLTFSLSYYFQPTR